MAWCRASVFAWIAAVGLLAAACATAGVESARVPDVSGTWVGTISPVGGMLATMAGVAAGEVRVTLVQRGREVSGGASLSGGRWTVRGLLYGLDFSGSITGETGQGAGGIPVNLTITGDRMEGFAEFSPITLRRAR